jgi:hypothetical protein
MSETATEKRLVEDIIEQDATGLWANASSIYEAQCAAANFTDQFRADAPGRPVMWDVVDYHEIPRGFIELCIKVAEYEVKL